MTETNWAGNIAYAAGSISMPRTVSEVQAAVKAAKKLRPLGSRHSFNRISDTGGTLLSLRGLERRFDLDRAANPVTVDGGMTYGELGPRLAAAGYALHNLASLPHISIVGAVATATHGSGNANRNLAGAVAGLELVTATGDIVQLSRSDAEFDGAVVNLGALGVVTSITLDLEPHFEVRQNV
jgi:xylitol oxidase